MRLPLVTLGILLCAQSTAQAQGFECPAPIKQVDTNIKGDISGSAQTLLKIGSADVKGTVDKTVVNLFEKYPNVDRVVMVQNYQSMTCNFLKNSTLPDEKKLDRILELATSLQKYLN
jgi:hypothetical protein